MKNLLAGLLVFSYCTCSSQDFSSYEFHNFYSSDLNLPYRFLRPANFDSSKKYPLIVFLHGAAHKGIDNEKQLRLGGLYFLQDSIRSKYPAYVLFPQCPENDSWAYFDVYLDSFSRSYKATFPFKSEPTTVGGVLKKLCDSLLNLSSIDRSRIYIGGLSQGGMGVLDMMARYPNLFAAGFSICGAGQVNTAKYFAGKVALWLFHGAIDDVVPVDFSREYFKKLRKFKADVRYTEYPNVLHNSWVNAFHEPELMSWLFSKGKKQIP